METINYFLKRGFFIRMIIQFIQQSKIQKDIVFQLFGIIIIYKLENLTEMRNKLTIKNRHLIKKCTQVEDFLQRQMMDIDMRSTIPLSYLLLLYSLKEIVMLEINNQ